MTAVELERVERVVSRVPDATLMRLHASTLAISERTAADVALLDVIGREWRRRKGA